MMSVVGITRMNTSAPTLTSSDAIFEMLASVLGEASLWMYSFQMLRLKRLAAAIHITEAGTSAPMAMAAKATPVNQLGNIDWKRSGTALLFLKSALGLTPAAL